MAGSSGGAYITGLRETIRALELLGVEVSDLKGVFHPVADKAAGIIRTHTPVQSGRLRASVKPNNAKNKAIVRAGSARVPYAKAINNGRYNAANGSRTQPTRFMQRADAVLTPTVLAEMVQDGLNELLIKYGITE